MYVQNCERMQRTNRSTFLESREHDDSQETAINRSANTQARGHNRDGRELMQ